nr:hypothetical protein [Anaerolineae bacterium]
MTLCLQVDQSSKVEQTNKPTVVAYSNEEQRALLMPAKVKREVLARLRRGGRSRRASVQLVFAALLALLLREAAERADVILIDVEYMGQEAAIKGQLLRFLGNLEVHVESEVLRFGFVGKKSPAHELAIAVRRGKRRPDHRVTLEELWALLG